MARQVDRLLQSDTRAAHHHLWLFTDIAHVQTPLMVHLVGILHSSIYDAFCAAGRDTHTLLTHRDDLIGLVGEHGRLVREFQHDLKAIALHLIAQRVQLLLQVFGRIEFLLAGVCPRHYVYRL